jgi:hypothetical protein
MKLRRVVTSLFITAVLSSGALPAFAVGTVKVECIDSSCGSLTLRQVCAKYREGSVPVRVSCDESADGDQPWCGPAPVPCGNGHTCWNFGPFGGSDNVYCYCGDGFQNDVLVTCG